MPLASTGSSVALTWVVCRRERLPTPHLCLRPPRWPLLLLRLRPRPRQRLRLHQPLPPRLHLHLPLSLWLHLPLSLWLHLPPILYRHPPHPLPGSR